MTRRFLRPSSRADFTVISCAGNDVPEVVGSEIRRLRSEGFRTIGVFETTNVGAATLGAELTGEGIAHTLIGLPEAHGHALVAMASIVRCGLGLASFEEVRTDLALFLTAATRSRNAPELAQQLYRNQFSSANFRGRVEELETLIRAAKDSEALTSIAVRSWGLLELLLANRHGDGPRLRSSR